jgi:hypothetical protein
MDVLVLWGVVSIGAFVGKLVMGTLLLALAPDFVENVIDAVEDDPVASSRWGLAIFVTVAVGILLVALLVGVTVAVSLATAALVVYLVGGTIVFVAVGERLLDALDVGTSRWGHLLAGTLVGTMLATIPVVGLVANLVVDHVGLGTIAYRWRRG